MTSSGNPISTKVYSPVQCSEMQWRIKAPFVCQEPQTGGERSGRHFHVGTIKEHTTKFTKKFFFKWKFLRQFIFKSVFHGVFRKDNGKGFLNMSSNEPVHISKWVKITTKDTPNFKKMLGSQVQRPFSPSSTSERPGPKLWAVPRGIYHVIQKSFEKFPQ